MDLSALPSIYALVLFVCCFRPLVRRAGSHTNVWLVGWMFLLIHYLRLLIPVQSGPREVILRVVGVWSVELCGLSFLWAASNARVHRFRKVFIAELAVPILLLSALYLFHSWNLLQVAPLLLALPGAHLLAQRTNRPGALRYVGIGFAVLGLVLAVFHRLDPSLALGILMGAIFLSVAYLLYANAAKITRGLGLMIAGLGLWTLSCPLVGMGWLDPKLRLYRAFLDLPRYILAAGMILSFLDDYVGRTEELALHDPLTGLANRRLFQYRLNDAIEESQRTLTPVACVVIDVDNFKYINDTFGHPVGDGLLQALAKRLSWNLGPRDMLARTGGDEFSAVIAEAADEFHVRFVVGAMMAAGCVPVSIQEHAIDVHISVGIAICPQDACDSEKLHKAADDAMYQAKRRGGSSVVFSGEEIPQIRAV